MPCTAARLRTRRRVAPLSGPHEASRRHVWVDGRLEPADAPVLTTFDRGFQLGDGVFETVRVHGGAPLELALHVQRLRASAAALEIPLPDGLDAILADAIARLLAVGELESPGADVSVRVTVSRGRVDARGLLPPEATIPTMVVQAWTVPPTSPALLGRGLHLVIASIRRDPRSPLATVKTTSRADFVYARLEARRRGADDALFLTTDGHLAEATSASLFIVRGAELATPSLECGILVGTTREWLLRWAGEVGLTTREARLAPGELFAADEVFLASSVAGVLPVTMVDGRTIGDGRPGPWSMRARHAREAQARGEAARAQAGLGQPPVAHGHRMSGRGGS